MVLMNELIKVIGHGCDFEFRSSCELIPKYIDMTMINVSIDKTYPDFTFRQPDKAHLNAEGTSCLAMALGYENDPGWVYLRQSPEQLLAATTKKFDSKKNVWVADPEEGFVAAEIKSSKGDKIVVVTTKGTEKTLKKDEVQQMNPPKFEKTEDMANLTFLNDASVLHNLRQRYYSMMIYTYSGLFCVVINPYKRLPIYTESVCKMYIGKRRAEMPPHLFSVSDEAYRHMINDKVNQSMLITGESGAGKTENTKKVISYFASVGATQQAARILKPGDKKEASIEDQIVRTNPVLEAFGNAKTVRNNNSSRFGKFIRIHFNTTGKLAGADIEHYLLEKSRVIKQAAGERSYHIFYQIMSGQINGLKEKLFLTRDIRSYHFVSQAEITIDGIDDKEEMQITDESFDIMRFSEEEKTDLFKLVAGIMHMGEMKFKQRPREEQAECEDKSEGDLACKLWCVDPDKFIGSLLKPHVKVGTEWVNKGQNLEQVNWAVGALAKALFARMFTWLIKRCNKTLDAQALSRDFFIGVLDIAGFEIFDLNSFEQLWINFVNEKLQQFFNHHMFVLEQEEYQREGIKWEFIDFGLDLQACIELIEKPLGIISMLDEECIVPKASDLTLAQKLNDQHLGKHTNFQKPRPPKGKQAEAHLAIVHYAGTVRYNVLGWLEKNKDPLNDTAVEVLKSNGGMTLMSAIWEDYKTQEDIAKLTKAGKTMGKKKGKSASFMTVSMMYRESLNKLMTMLYQTHPHFIRCIIPNEQKKSGLIEANLVLNQLTCNGVLEGIRICRKGFPNRMLYVDFKQRYAVIAADEAKSGKDVKESSEKILEKLLQVNALKPEEFQTGHQKVFFKAGVLAHLEEMRDEALSHIITKFQSACRHYYAQYDLRQRIQSRAGLIIVQRNVRKWCALRNWSWFKLYGRVKPLIAGSKKDEEFEALEKKCKELEEKLKREEKVRKSTEDELTKVKTEKQELFVQLEQERDNNAESEERAAKLLAVKSDVEKQVTDLSDQLAEQEDRNEALQKARKKVESENENFKRIIAELENTIKKQETEKQSKDHQIRALQVCGNFHSLTFTCSSNCGGVSRLIREFIYVEEGNCGRYLEEEVYGCERIIRDRRLIQQVMPCLLQDEMASQDELLARTNKEKKHQEEVNRKLMEDIQTEEDKLNHMNKVRSKLEQSMDEVEDALEREKRSKADLEKAKRKLEGELKVAQENVDELIRQKHESENALKKKDAEMVSLSSHLEDEQSLVAKLQRQIKEVLARVQELEEELEAERQARSKAEKMRSEMQNELEELGDRLDEAGGATQAQMELNKKREAELIKLRRDIEETALSSENAMAALRKKHNDAVAELSDQLDTVQKARAKVEKEKCLQQRELEDMHAQLDAEYKQRQNIERLAKQLEAQLTEVQLKGDEQARQLQELIANKNKVTTENNDLNRQVEDAENQVAALNRVKQQLSSQIEELRRQLEQETRERQTLAAQNANFQLECQQLRETIEEEQDSKSELQRLISKANAEAQQWRTRFEGEGMARAEELEDARRKLQAKLQELQEQLENANSKISSLEKSRQHLSQELEDAQIDADRANSLANAMDKKQKGFDKIVDEWKHKCDLLVQELESSQRDARSASTEVFRLRSNLDESAEQIEAIRRENKALSQELKDLTDQLSEGGKNVHELQKSRRRLEMEKDELQQALDDAEAALEAEESKVLRSQVEISQIRSEIDKRINEKEEEFENTRKNHQRALESMQASLETETRGRTELLRMKKKLESDINDLEVALDHANKANVDAQKNIKKYQDNIRELQTQIEDEQHQRDEIREQVNVTERRSQILQSEKEDLAVQLEQVRIETIDNVSYCELNLRIFHLFKLFGYFITFAHIQQSQSQV
ncbi:unnamed protein product [Anisakis simplex]|uniref:Myosin motor domain-containing protein n=1 Tax=Anisakis simplex TaxID=6269 RepID=A0A0M3K2R2_ANISI|nr:unnamed protein product [Anisakis simplex]